jgi:anti-anti-sigma regulatory factor
VIHQIDIVDGITIVRLKVRDLGKANFRDVKRAISQGVDFSRPALLDFGSVEAFDCSGLSVIVYWMAQGHRAHGISVLCAESAPLRALIELVRIPDFASVHSSLREALDVCRQQVAAGAEHEEIKNVSPRTRAAAAGGA